jgi:hypothetical protein
VLFQASGLADIIGAKEEEEEKEEAVAMTTTYLQVRGIVPKIWSCVNEHLFYPHITFPENRPQVTSCSL